MERDIIEALVDRRWVAMPILEQAPDTPGRKIDDPPIGRLPRNRPSRRALAFNGGSRSHTVSVRLRSDLQYVQHAADIEISGDLKGFYGRSNRNVEDAVWNGVLL